MQALLSLLLQWFCYAQSAVLVIHLGSTQIGNYPNSTQKDAVYSW